MKYLKRNFETKQVQLPVKYFFLLDFAVIKIFFYPVRHDALSEACSHSGLRCCHWLLAVVHRCLDSNHDSTISHLPPALPSLTINVGEVFSCYFKEKCAGPVKILQDQYILGATVPTGRVTF